MISTINSPAITFEVNQQGKTNILVLQQNIQTNTKSSKKQTYSSAKNNTNDKSKRFIIKKLTISAKVDAHG